MSLIHEQYFFERASLGLINGVSKVNLQGRNQAITTSDETIYAGSTLYTMLTTAVAFEVISSSANDASAGTGARTVSIDLVDGNYTQTTVTATMNGTSAVAITGTYLACNGIRVATAGSGLGNAGTITVRTVSGSTTQAQIQLVGGNRSQDFIYTIPAGYKGLLTGPYISTVGATGHLTFKLFTGGTDGIQSVQAEASTSTSSANLTEGTVIMYLGYYGLAIPEKTQVSLRGVASAGAGDVKAFSELFLFDGSQQIFGL